ncbi:hypothetical protein F4810DRAFT_24065 [Camillea tinctor]|nr:hypothetical protein F4810DRAFT_24065 [Camillea tinctor]
MSWTQENGYWRRPLDCHDKLFKSIAAAGAPLGREHWVMVHWLQLSFPSATEPIVQEQRLRSAWSALRCRHPDVALTLHEDEKRYEPLVDDHDLQRWTAATFHVETEVRSADELFSRHLKIAPSAHATCHWIPASSELAIVSSHWRWDGRGVTMMLHSFMDLLGSNPSLSSSLPSSLATAGAEAKYLVPTLDTIIGAPTVPKEELERKADELLAPFMDGSPAIGLPVAPAVPGDTVRTAIVFPRAVTTAVLEACRARGIRLAAALHASIVLETARYYKPVEETAKADVAPKYKSWAAFDLRRYCPPPFNGEAHAASLRMVALPLIADPTASWSELASTFQACYSQSLAPPDSDILFVRVPYVEKATAMLGSAPPTTEPNLSNLGVLDNYFQRRYGDVEVRDAALAVQMLSAQLYVHTWRWDEQMRVSICYNEAFYEEQFVRGWLEGLKANLLENLGIDNSDITN